jgi:hypothetical protein
VKIIIRMDKSLEKEKKYKSGKTNKHKRRHDYSDDSSSNNLGRKRNRSPKTNKHYYNRHRDDDSNTTNSKRQVNIFLLIYIKLNRQKSTKEMSQASAAGKEEKQKIINVIININPPLLSPMKTNRVIILLHAKNP